MFTLVHKGGYLFMCPVIMGKELIKGGTLRWPRVRQRQRERQRGRAMINCRCEADKVNSEFPNKLTISRTI